MESPNNPSQESGREVSLWEAFRTWSRVAALSFGGPAGQIAVMHRIIVQEKRWISEERFLHALNYCMLLPGPEAQQLATYIGWLMHRTVGGLMAGVLFVLPGAISILALSLIYAVYGQVSIVQALFFGLKPAIIAVVIQAILRIGKRVLKNRVMVAISGSAFIAIYFFDIPFPLIIVSGAAIGFLGQRLSPATFQVMAAHGKSTEDDARLSQAEVKLHIAAPSLQRSVGVLFISLLAWFGPLIAIAFVSGTNSVYFQEGTFFSKAAVVTFGGAYSVLAYIAQQAVEHHQWLKAGEMMDGLGMAESTPGPLIMVVQFVGFMAAYRNPGALNPIAAGVLGSAITTWVTFVPCFLWIFLGAPYIEKLRNNQLISSALAAITACVVGVILNLTLWFSLHTLFMTIDTQQFGLVRVLIPKLSSVDLGATLIAVQSIALMFWFKRGLFTTLAAAIASGVVWKTLLY